MDQGSLVRSVGTFSTDCDFAINLEWKTAHVSYVTKNRTHMRVRVLIDRERAQCAAHFFVAKATWSEAWWLMAGIYRFGLAKQAVKKVCMLHLH